MVTGVIVLVAAGIIFLSITSRHTSISSGVRRFAIAFVISPFQSVVNDSVRSIKDFWRHYFFLVSAAKENDDLKKALSRAVETNNQCRETELSNARLRKFLNFQKTKAGRVLAAEVVGRDPSPWFKAIIVDKGKADGIERDFPVVVSDGIVGQVAEVADHYSKVMLIIDRNSSVDALVQRSRARGIVKGESAGQCAFEYVLSNDDIMTGDNVVSSGLDGVYPKGLRIGFVTGIVKNKSEIFQATDVMPYVNFEKLEEVLIVLNPARHDFVSE